MFRTIRKIIYRLRRKAEYKEYMRSGTWDAKRKEALRRAGYQCETCGARDTVLQVHHKTYDRFGGRERQTDLQVLCIPCHKQADRVRKQENQRRYGKRRR